MAAEPTPFHRMMGGLAKAGRLLRLYSQNIDGIDTDMPSPFRRQRVRRIVQIWRHRLRPWLARAMPDLWRIEGLCGITALHVATLLVYFLANVAFVSKDVGDRSTLEARVAVAAVTNLAPVLLGGRTNMFADRAGITLQLLSHPPLGRENGDRGGAGARGHRRRSHGAQMDTPGHCWTRRKYSEPPRNSLIQSIGSITP